MDISPPGPGTRLDSVSESEEREFIRQHPNIVVGGEMDWPPMDYVENGEYKGAAKDYLD